MKVKQLIKKLNECDGEKEILIEGIKSDIVVLEFENGTVHLYTKDRY